MPAVQDSILLTVKQLMGGLDPTYDEAFDTELIITINSAIGKLTQLGIGPAAGFRITSDEQTWTDFLGDDKRLDMAKEYVYLDVKCTFDPPRLSFVLDSLKSQRDELGWRLNTWVDTEYTDG